jgi:hypothetical protein
VRGGSNSYVSISFENFDTNMNYYLFARNKDNIAISMAKMKIFAYKLYSAGALKRDYIPALDKDGTPCLYDRVSKKCFYNAGTGSFIAG